MPPDKSLRPEIKKHNEKSRWNTLFLWTTLVANKLHQTKRYPYNWKSLQCKNKVTGVWDEKSTCCRKIRKNKVNENGNLLTEFCKLHSLLIAYTIFKQRPSHQTTWISPLPFTFSRKTPYRNQIDYILLRKNMNSKIFDSRSVSSNFTRSNQKPVIAKIQIKWTYTKKAASARSFNSIKLQNTQIAENYIKKVNQIIKSQAITISNQEKWNNNLNTLKSPAEKILGYNHK